MYFLALLITNKNHYNNPPYQTYNNTNSEMIQMKKNKRISLLIAGGLMLGASILMPTILSACSTFNGLINQDGYNDHIHKLNEEENAGTRKRIYAGYLNELTGINNTTSSRLAQLQSVQITKPFNEIVKEESFFHQLISMFESDLDATSSELTEEQLSALISEMKTNINFMTSSNSNDGSLWSADAFKFDDTDIPTWTFNLGNWVQYELYLTSDVELTYHFDNDVASIRITNKNSSKNKSRLSVKSSAIDRSKFTDIHFKTNIDFQLPVSLFADFDAYFNAYTENFKNEEVKKHIEAGFKKYYETLNDSNKKDGSILWNQFALTNETAIKVNLESDLNTNRLNSKLIQWIDESFSNENSFLLQGLKPVSIISDLKQDITAAESIHLEMPALLIQKQHINERSQTKIYLSFDAGSNTKLSQKSYVLDLYATGLNFTYNFTSENFGFADDTLNSWLKISFAPNSSITLFLPDETTGVNTRQKAAKFKQNHSVDVSSIFDKDYSSFSNFLLEMLIQPNVHNVKVSNLLLEKQDDKKFLTDKFKSYLLSDAQKIAANFKKPNVLADLIFDNIDLNNMAMYTHNQLGTSGDDTVITNKAKWKDKVNTWLTGRTPPTITIGNKANPETRQDINWDEVEPNNEVSKLLETADIKIQATVGKNDLYLEDANNNQVYSGIYIFLSKNGSDVKNLNINAGYDYGSASSNVSLESNQKEILTNKNFEILKFIEAAEASFTVVFQKSNKFAPHKPTPLYAYYMGQQLSKNTQTSFPISLNKLVANSDLLIQELLKK